ncbi:hypothetical protein THER5_1898 [Bifidobacterium thermacidophilum subsp. thermacidophilum]|uniref:Uncharacterized protein n=1 Tax=Bifidobacterium thermacidophilum subsp. thermacidophilum TaxID=79262 RepID=A0A087E280_9BIFI|nr:hypothetical protein THER5_1898 [Bifidobacterium thermacidophilum subsp. thermacidophilum]
MRLLGRHRTRLESRPSCGYRPVRRALAFPAVADGGESVGVLDGFVGGRW